MNYTKTKFTCNRGNLTIRGVEYRPEGENLPIVIISHGFMATHKSVMQYVKFFAENSYAAFAYDFCGGCAFGGKSDGLTTDMSVLTEVEDLKAVIDYATSLPYTNADSVTLMGCSQGGFVSALTAAELKEKISKIVLFYPALCIPDDARSGKMMFAKFDPNNPPEKFRCGPMKLGKQYVTDVIGMGPYEEITPYEGDVLIVHGTKDKIVNLSYAVEAEKAYSARENGTVKLHIIEKAKHGFSRKFDTIAISHIKDFI